MRRRRFIVGFGGITVGAASFIGTGAISSTTADREVELAIAQDSQAYLRLHPADRVADTEVGTGVLTVDLDEELQDATDQAIPEGDGGDGFAPRSVYEIDGISSDYIFQIENQGDRKVEVSAETRDQEGPTIELYDVTDNDREAITEGNEAELAVGGFINVGLRVIVPDGTKIKDYDQQIIIRAIED